MPKRELIRIVRTPEGDVEIDLRGKKSGRGAYLCQQQACWQKMVQGGQLERALRMTLSREDKEALFEARSSAKA
jgi:hypothetical protein